MLEIKITDPHLMDKNVLFKLAELLCELSGRSLIPAPKQHPMTMSVPVPAPAVAPSWPVASNAPLPPVSFPILNTEELNEKFHDMITKDVNGMPWDSRIHSRTKSKNSDGTWRYMRGIDPAIIQSVESELRQAVNAPEPLVIPPPEPIIQEANDFPAFMTLATSAVHSGKLTQAQLITIIQEFGLPSVPVVATRPDLIPGIINKLKGVIQ